MASSHLMDKAACAEVRTWFIIVEDLDRYWLDRTHVVHAFDFKADAELCTAGNLEKRNEGMNKAQTAPVCIVRIIIQMFMKNKERKLVQQMQIFHIKLRPNGLTNQRKFSTHFC